MTGLPSFSLSKKSGWSWAFSDRYGRMGKGDEKMLERGKMDRDLVEFVVIDQLVPKEHLLRKIDAAVDFTRLYEMVEPLYCEDNGRPSIDPVVLFKMVLIQHLYGLPSLRRTAEEVSANNCYRWFLGYPLQEETPHFSTVSYNFRHRFTDDDNDPPASPRKHKDNTSKKKLARRKKQGFRTVTKSVTDPDCGLFVKGGHKRQFAYEAHTACDKNGFVLETVVTPGNVHDSVAFDEVYDKVTENFPQVEAVVADAAYKTPHICKKVFGDGRVLSTAYKRPQTMKNGHEWWKYVYDEFYNCVICPEYQPLKYSTTNRDGYREYKSDPNICAACPTSERCTHSRDCIKTVQRHIWKDYEELADDARYTPAYAQLYKCRKETIERVFADAKEKHAMRYTQYRGLAQVTNWVKLKFAAMNSKKLATWKWRNLLSSFRFAVFSLIYVRDPVCS